MKLEGRTQDVVPKESHLFSLLDGPFQVLYRQRVFRPDIHITALASDSIGGDEHSFENQMRVAFQNAPVHESSGVPFVGIADDIFHISGSTPGESPFPSRGETRAPAATEAGPFHFLDYLLRGHGEENLAQRPVALAGNVIADLRRVDPSVVAENPAHLALIEGDLVIVNHRATRDRVDVKQSLQDPTTQKRFGDNLRNIFDGHLLVKDLLRENDDHRPSFAKTMATRAHDVSQSLKALLTDLLFEGQTNLLASPCPATCPSANGHTSLIGVSLTDNTLSQFL